MSVNYLLHESPVGYAIFQVVHQPDIVGSRLKEVQESVQVRHGYFEGRLRDAANDTQDLAKLGKMVKLLSFAPFQ